MQSQPWKIINWALLNPKAWFKVHKTNNRNQRREEKREHRMLTCWYSDNEGFGVWPRASPVCGPDFEQIAFPRLQTVHQGRSGVSREGEGLCSKWFESRGIWKNVFWNDLADGWKEENANSPASSRQTVWAEWVRTHMAEANTLAMNTWSTAAAEEWGARQAHTR